MRRRSALFCRRNLRRRHLRNVLWNLPHPERALKEWMRVLKPGGRLLYEDGNHYRHLVDPLFKHHHDNMPAPFGHQPQYMLNVDTSAIDAIAQTLPLTQELRPQWDLQALIDLGFTETQVIEPSLSEVSDPLSGKASASSPISSQQRQNPRLPPSRMSQLRLECPETPSAIQSSSTFALSECLMLTRRTLLLSAAAASLAMLPFASFAAEAAAGEAALGQAALPPAAAGPLPSKISQDAPSSSLRSRSGSLLPTTFRTSCSSAAETPSNALSA